MLHQRERAMLTLWGRRRTASHLQLRKGAAAILVSGCATVVSTCLTLLRAARALSQQLVDDCHGQSRQQIFDFSVREAR